MNAPRSLAVGWFALLVGAAGCTVGVPRTERDKDGWETVTSYQCDWKRDSSFLKPGRVPNSPFMPYTRAYWADVSLFAVIFGMPVDLIASPIAYFADRNCEVAGTDRRYVGTPESVARERRQQAEAARLAQAEAARRAGADQAAEKARELEAAKKREEAEAYARLYPPLSDSPRPAAARPDDFALIIGIEGYRSIPKADYGEDDAKLMKTYVESLGVPSANVILLSGAGASRADIAKYLEEWLPGVVKADSRVYFYYSGHGAPEPSTGEAYLVPYDGDPKFLKSTAFPLAKIYADLGALPVKESIVMLDSCFSGAGGRSVLVAGARPLVVVREITSAPPHTAILAASGGSEIAGGLDVRRHGLFTYFVARGLSGQADADHDGHVTLGELAAYAREGVRDAARRDNRDQTPLLLGDAGLKLY